MEKIENSSRTSLKDQKSNKIGQVSGRFNVFALHTRAKVVILTNGKVILRKETGKLKKLGGCLKNPSGG
jgi:hypothetical protein